jgi:CheY-like chemotaxis protein
LNIAEQKLPDGQKVTIACPKCKKKLVIERPRPKADEARDEGTPPQRAPGEDYEYGDEDTAIDLQGEASRLALVMETDSANTEKLKGILEGLGYRAVFAKDTRDALGKMRFHHFGLSILADRFDGMGLAQSPILHYLNHLSMSIRRRMFLVLMGTGFRTMDNMTAFAMSANMVVNPKDLEKFGMVLKKSLMDHERFYKVFLETLTDVGKC